MVIFYVMHLEKTNTQRLLYLLHTVQPHPLFSVRQSSKPTVYSVIVVSVKSC